MALVNDIAVWILLGLGSFFYLVGAIGLVRMPDLFTRIKSTLGAPAVFPLREYWIDIGRAADLIRAHREYGNVFTGQER